MSERLPKRHFSAIAFILIFLILCWMLFVCLVLPTGSSNTKNSEGMENWTVDDVFAKHIVDYDNDISQLTFKQAKTFYRDHLDDETKSVYTALKNGIAKHSEEILLPGNPDRNEIQLALTFVSYDCPEMFWFKPSGTIIREGTVRFKPDYTMSKAEVAEYQNSVDDFANSAIEECSALERRDMREKLLSIIADSTVYDADSEHGRQALGVTKDGRAYCAGYARAEMIVLRKLGVPCVYVEGTAKSPSKDEEAHAWVLVVENGEISVDDPTWYDSDETGIHNPEWFDRSWKDFSETHFPKMASAS